MSAYSNAVSPTHRKVTYESPYGEFAGWFIHSTWSSEYDAEIKTRIETMFGLNCSVSYTVSTVSVDPAVFTII